MLAKPASITTRQAALFARPAYDMPRTAYLAARKEYLQHTIQLASTVDSHQSPLPFDQLTIAQGDRTRAAATRNRAGYAQWKDLPGTTVEQTDLQTLLDGKQHLKIVPESVYTDTRATEFNFKSMSTQQPAILHISTHGYFKNLLPGQDPDKAEPPFRRTGLVFAGANQLGLELPEDPIQRQQEQRDRGDDGLLTAEEVAQLDLAHTKLVVLSACLTGMGDIIDGQGVMGLNRAFLLAGAQGVVVSLFEVSDEKTPLLMKAFYQKLNAGIEPYQALLQAKKELKQKFPLQPYYWGSFIYLGQNGS